MGYKFGPNSSLSIHSLCLHFTSLLFQLNNSTTFFSSMNKAKAKTINNGIQRLNGIVVLAALEERELITAAGGTKRERAAAVK